MKNSVSTILIVATPLMFAGCIVEEHPGHPHRVYAPPPPHAEVVVVQPASPPPTKVEVIPPRPNMGFVWVPGAWEWENGRWIWVGGRWAPPAKHGAVWIGGHWEKHGHGQVWVPGHWR
ncbi:MAG TPA: hypothetical protein VN625_05390 [Desulfuromonadaceae bacterium]|nr:hypothetical protein [Desulfuromonadaceae bacterium]